MYGDERLHHAENETDSADMYVDGLRRNVNRLLGISRTYIQISFYTMGGDSSCLGT